MPQSRTKTGKFAKGHSGNPGGRPKKPVELKELADRSLDELKSILDSTENEKIKVEICKWLYEMQYGKAMQRQEVDGSISTDLLTVRLEGELADFAQ